MNNLIGKKFGCWTILKEAPPKIYKSQKRKSVECQCKCGVIKEVALNLLKRGRTTKCHRCKMKILREKSIIHGETINRKKTKEFSALMNIKARCSSPKQANYKNYGGRGIKVCERWILPKKGFINFLSDLGRCPCPQSQYSLDRINFDKDYTPENTRWTTTKTQARNKRNNLIIEYNGERKCLEEWSEIKNIKRYTLHARIFSLGWSLKRAMETSVPTKRQN